MKTPLRGCTNPQGQQDGMREWQRGTSPSLKSSSQLCSRPETMGHLTCDTSGEGTEPLRGQQLSEEDWVGLRIRPRPSCMLAEAGCLHSMQATPPLWIFMSDAYQEWSGRLRMLLLLAVSLPATVAAGTPNCCSPLGWGSRLHYPALHIFFTF